MDIDECITAYVRLSDRVFKKTKYRLSLCGTVQGRFGTRAGKIYQRNILQKTGSEDTLLYNRVKDQCKLYDGILTLFSGSVLTDYVRSALYVRLGEKRRVPCSSQAILREGPLICYIPLRSMKQHEQLLPLPHYMIPSRLVFLASGLATVAQAQTIQFGRFGMRRWMSCPKGNPSKRLSGVWSPSAQEYLEIKPFGSKFWTVAETLKRIATETEAMAEQFDREHSRLDQRNQYFRFSVVRGLEKIGLEDAAQKGAIVAATRQYVESEAVGRQLQLCRKNLERKSESLHMVPIRS
jgi:hypothetical protein